MRAKRAAAERPRLDEALPDIVRYLVSANRGDLGHIDPGGLLFVAGSARREAAASIRPFFFPGGTSRDATLVKPEVNVNGRVIRYEICLRPRFFRLCDAAHRLRILVHELWHIDPSFDGSLAPERRHDACPASVARAFAERVAHDAVNARPDGPWSVLGYAGEVSLAAWLNRPPSRLPHGSGFRTRYSDTDLYPSIIEQL